ncbi:MAG TPA: hypothetical protein VMZ53_02765 [Kofleriaceae bacterium]|nr:hypothetical protein [Kofleriaceae bacterium]
MTDDPAMMLRAAGPGSVATWVRWLVASACVVTVLALLIGGNLLVRELAWFDEQSQGQFWMRRGIAYLAMFAIIGCLLPGSRLSRFLHAAIVLPILHAVLVVIGWNLWQHELPMLSNMSDGRAFAAWFPFSKVALIAIPSTALVAGVIARRRKAEWAHAFTMLSLSMLLLVGLWMPIALGLWGNAPGDTWVTDPVVEDYRVSYFKTLLPHPLEMTLLIVIPPIVAGIAYTTLSLRRSAWVRAHRKGFIIATSILLGLAILFRMGAAASPMVLYSNFVPLLLVGVLVAVSALVALAFSMLMRGYRLRRRFISQERMVGVVVADSKEPIFGFEIPSWLRGPRLVQRTFAISTSQGTIPVTGAELVAPLPTGTTLLGRDETLGLIHPGDTVIIAGQTEDAGGPFRSTTAPLAGSLYVAPADVERAGLVSAALAMWRPCVAYLLIVTAVALPGLAALLSG